MDKPLFGGVSVCGIARRGNLLPRAIRDLRGGFARFQRAAAIVGALILVGPPIAFAQNSAIQPRITAQINESDLTTLRGNTHPLARPQYDQGAVADSQPMRRMLLLLQRSPAQETALRTLIDQQQSKASPNFHQWLTPQQFGQQFGPAAADIQSVTSWLQSHGFQIARVSTGGTLIEFSGTAGQVRDAFHTEIHRYLVNGETHFANNSEPQIPTALVPVVAGPVSLHNFPRKALARVRGAFQKDKATGKVTPLPSPALTFPFSECSMNPIFSSNCFALGPGDFATIYNVNPLWSTGVGGHPIDGTNQTIAIVGDSEICTANSPDWMTSYIGPLGTTVTCSSDDVAQFRLQFGLLPVSPNVIVDGPDPGFNSDETEGDLDVQWSGAIAKNATIDFVIAEGTEASAGTDLAAEYIVDNNLAPVMSESFGECEVFLLNGGNEFESSLWEQAAAQGITVIVSAGDSGSAGCDNPDFASPNLAVNGASVNGIASTPFNVAAGGTDFDISSTNYPAAYWATTNTTSAANGLLNVSALKYIPETVWNDSCARTGAAGCSSSSNLLDIIGGGGGQSTCVAPAQDLSGNITCQTETFTSQSVFPGPGWSKPSYQIVATGSGLNAGNDLTRDVPDISLFAAEGLVSNSFYIICEADQTGGPCSLSQGFIGVGGTSSAAPTFAAMMALVNQNMQLNYPSLPARQGNANYVLYPLFAAQQTAELACNSSSGPAATCTFNDITKGNDSVPCQGASFNCTSLVSNGVGIVETGTPANTPSYIAGTGYDAASGLGSVNAFNLVSKWPLTVGNFTATTTTLCLSTTSGGCPSSTTASSISGGAITHGTTVYVSIGVTSTKGAPPAATLTTAEDVALIGTFSGGATQAVDRFDPNTGNADIYSLASGGTVINASTSELVGGTYTVNAHYGGDGTFGSSTSTPGISITVNQEGSTIGLSVGSVNSQGGVSPLTSVPYGTFEIVRADVKGATSGLETGTGTVSLMDKNGPIVTGTDTTTTSFPLNTEGYTEDQTAFLSIGSHSFTGQYTGDASYMASAVSTAVPFTVTQGPTTTAITTSATTVAANTPITLTAFVDTQSATNPTGGSLGLSPSGTVTFFNGTTNLGTATLSSVASGDANGFDESMATRSVTLTASGTITVVYNGDVNYTSSTSSGVAVTVGSPGLNTSTGCSATINISSVGGSGTCVINVSGANSFAGTVMLGYSLAPSGAVDPPTCTFGMPGQNFSGSNTITLSTSSETGSATMTCFTTASSVAVFRPSNRPPVRGWPLAGVAIGLLSLFFLVAVPRQRRWGMVPLAVLLCVVVVAGVSCGGGSSGGGGLTNPGTTTGAYTLTVSATPTGGTASMIRVTLNVQ